MNITSAAWAKYQAERLAEGYAPATINRERSALVRMFRLGLDHGLVLNAPKLDRLPEDNVRDVDIGPSEFARLADCLPEYLRPVAIVAFITGWRRIEVLSRNWVDLDEDWLWLDRESAKTRQPRAFPLGVVPWLDETLSKQWERKGAVEKATGRLVRPLFFYLDGPRAGEPIRSFRKAWATACKAASLPGLHFHDLRRSAAVQMLEAGIPETHAMRLLGHRTRSIFARYAISNRHVLRSQVEKLAEHYGTAPKPDRKVISLGTR